MTRGRKDRGRPGKTAPEYFWESHERLAAQNRLFMEIMTGPNPLTPEEVRLLIRRRPEVWRKYEKFAAPEEAGR